MHIVFYITGHGYGHGVRSAALSNALAPDVEITFCSALPRLFFEEEIERPFCWRSVEYDCGCIQENSLTVDIETTLHTYMRIADRNAALLDGEVAWLREVRADVVLSDITPYAFEIASKAGVPSIAVTNFTWYDIYEQYLSIVPDFEPYCAHMARQYGMADLLLALEPSNAMAPITAPRRSIPVIGRTGRDRRKDLRTFFGLRDASAIGLIYAGTFGIDTADWSGLSRFENWDFVGVYPLPNAAPNYHVVSKSDFRYQDLMASADCVITKIGYGVYAECLLHGLPLIYAPRTNFAEHEILENGVREWGGGVRLELPQFTALQWRDALAKCRKMGRLTPRKSAAPVAAGAIEQFVEQR